jgi:hypothetical protein
LEKIFVVILLDMELHNEEMQEAEDNCFKEWLFLLIQRFTTKSMMIYSPMITMMHRQSHFLWQEIKNLLYLWFLSYLLS